MAAGGVETEGVEAIGAGAFVEAAATLSVVVVKLPDDEEVDDTADDAEATGPVPESILATTGAAVPVVAPVPVIGPGLVPG